MGPNSSNTLGRGAAGQRSLGQTEVQRAVQNPEHAAGHRAAVLHSSSEPEKIGPRLPPLLQSVPLSTFSFPVATAQPLTVGRGSRTNLEGAHAVELSPAYVDVAVARWQAFTGEVARLEGDGASFAEVAQARGVAAEQAS